MKIVLNQIPGLVLGLFTGLFSGLFVGLLLGATVLLVLGPSSVEAQKPSQMDIIYRISSQNFYMTQKILAYAEYTKDLSLLLADRNKVKVEQIVPLTNKLQQEVFALDLKIREVSK